MKKLLFLVACQCMLLFSVACAESSEWVSDTYDFSAPRRVLVELDLPDALSESVEGDMAYDILWEKLDREVVKKLPKGAYTFVPSEARERHPNRQAVVLKRLDPAGNEVRKVELLKDAQETKRPVSPIIPQDVAEDHMAEGARITEDDATDRLDTDSEQRAIREGYDLVLRVRVREWDTISRYREGYYRLVPVEEYHRVRDADGNIHTFSTIDYEYRYEPPHYLYASYVAVRLQLNDAKTGEVVWRKTDRRARMGTDVASMYQRAIGSFCTDLQKRLQGAGK